MVVVLYRSQPQAVWKWVGVSWKRRALWWWSRWMDPCLAPTAPLALCLQHASSSACTACGAIGRGQDATAKWAAFLFRMWKVPCSNLVLESDYDWHDRGLFTVGGIRISRGRGQLEILRTNLHLSCLRIFLLIALDYWHRRIIYQWPRGLRHDVCWHICI